MCTNAELHRQCHASSAFLRLNTRTRTMQGTRSTRSKLTLALCHCGTTQTVSPAFSLAGLWTFVMVFLFSIISISTVVPNRAAISSIVSPCLTKYSCPNLQRAMQLSVSLSLKHPSTTFESFSFKEACALHLPNALQIQTNKIPFPCTIISCGPADQCKCKLPLTTAPFSLAFTHANTQLYVALTSATSCASHPLGLHSTQQSEVFSLSRKHSRAHTCISTLCVQRQALPIH